MFILGILNSLPSVYSYWINKGTDEYEGKLLITLISLSPKTALPSPSVPGFSEGVPMKIINNSSNLPKCLNLMSRSVPIFTQNKGLRGAGEMVKHLIAQ